MDMIQTFRIDYNYVTKFSPIETIRYDFRFIKEKSSKRALQQLNSEIKKNNKIVIKKTFITLIMSNSNIPYDL